MSTPPAAPTAALAPLAQGAASALRRLPPVGGRLADLRSRAYTWPFAPLRVVLDPAAYCPVILTRDGRLVRTRHARRPAPLIAWVCLVLVELAWVVLYCGAHPREWGAGAWRATLAVAIMGTWAGRVFTGRRIRGLLEAGPWSPEHPSDVDRVARELRDLWTAADPDGARRAGVDSGGSLPAAASPRA